MWRKEFKKILHFELIYVLFTFYLKHLLKGYIRQTDNNNHVKAKVTPCHAHTATQGRRRCSANTFTTSASEGSVWEAPLADSFNPEKYPVPIIKKGGWMLERSGRPRKISAPLGFDPLTIQLAPSRYTIHTNNIHIQLLN